MSSPAQKSSLPSLRAVLVAILAGAWFAFMTVLIEESFVNNRARTLLTASLSPRQVAEIGVQKAVYCLNAASAVNCGADFGPTFSGETDVAVGDGTYTTTITAADETHRLIESVGRTPSGWPITVTAEASAEPRHQNVSFPPPTDRDAAPEINLDFWRNAAAAGGISHGKTVLLGDDAKLGNVKVEGDLKIDGQASVTVDGPVWVTGDLFIGGPHGKLTLDPAFGPYGTVIIVEGQVIIEKGASVLGTPGDAGRVLIVSTAVPVTADWPAIAVWGLKGDALLFAAQGAIELSGDVEAEAISALRLSVSPTALLDVGPEGYEGLLSTTPVGTWMIIEP